MITRSEISSLEFLVHFQPQRNHLTDQAHYFCFRYETFGREYAYVCTVDPDRVWTLIERDDLLVIDSGYRGGEVRGYVITDSKVDPGLEIEVVFDDRDEPIPGEFPLCGAHLFKELS